jgi:hypothetical protein
MDAIQRFHDGVGEQQATEPLREGGGFAVRRKRLDDGTNTSWLLGQNGDEFVILCDGIQTYQEAALLVTDVATGACFMASDGVSPYIKGMADAVLEAVHREVPRGARVVVAGHSMGGALADYVAHDLAATGGYSLQLLSVAAPRFSDEEAITFTDMPRSRWFFVDDPIAGSVPRPIECPTVAGSLGPAAAYFASRQRHRFRGMAMFHNGGWTSADSPWQFTFLRPASIVDVASLILSMFRRTHAAGTYSAWFGKRAEPTKPFFPPLAPSPAEYVQSATNLDSDLIIASLNSTIALVPRADRERIVRKVRAGLKERDLAKILGSVIKARPVRTGYLGNQEWSAQVLGINIAYGPRKSSVAAAAKAWNLLMRAFLNDSVTVDLGNLQLQIGQAVQLATSTAGGTTPLMVLTNP